MEGIINIGKGNYRDGGCYLHKSCLNCPEETDCKYVEPYERWLQKIRRNLEMRIAMTGARDLLTGKSSLFIKEHSQGERLKGG